MINIAEICEQARYSEILESLITKLKGKEILRLTYESDYQGFVDIDVLLENGRVFSYQYWYGSCSGCDEWEDRCLTEQEIEDIMETEATFFDDFQQYQKWRESVMERNK